MAKEKFLNAIRTGELWDKIKTTFVSNSDLETAVNTIEGAIDEKAPLDSPNLIGTPTAPTPSLTSNDDTIATTSFVHNSLGNLIIITISPAIEGVIATLTHTETNSVYTGTSNSLGQISLTINEFGTYNLTFSNPNVKATKKVYIVTPGVLQTIPATYSINACYTVSIDLTNSNPATCCSYEDDAYGMTGGSTEWSNKSIFNEIRPCVVKNSIVQYYLNPNDFSKKLDGSDAVLTGEDGDVMVEFGKFAYFIETDTENNTLKVSITNNSDLVSPDSRYHYYAFTHNTEGDMDNFYLGAYKGSIDADGKLRSIYGQMPANTKTLANFKAAAQLNGEDYTITNYFQLVALQCLYLIRYCNLNGQTALGNGVVGRVYPYSEDNPSSGPVPTGGVENKGMYYGSTSNGSGTDIEAARLSHVKFAGIEDFWGNIWEWVDGLTTDANRKIITTCGESTWTTETGLTENSYGYVSKVTGTTETGFMNVEHGGSSTTYFCDYGSLYASCVLKFGAHWFNDSSAGPFCLNATNGTSAALSYVGARLSKYGNTTSSSN